MSGWVGQLAGDGPNGTESWKKENILNMFYLTPIFGPPGPPARVPPTLGGWMSAGPPLPPQALLVPARPATVRERPHGDRAGGPVQHGDFQTQAQGRIGAAGFLVLQQMDHRRAGGGLYFRVVLIC